jgi:hypothetical protein
LWVAGTYVRGQVRQVEEVREKNLGYDLTRLDLRSGEVWLIQDVDTMARPRLSRADTGECGS